jgi:mannosylfructose-phosphate synthase
MFSKKTDLSAKKIGRVCFLNPQGYVTYPPPLGKTDTGGQTIYVLQLAEALGKKNIKVDIITRQFDGMSAEEQVFPNVKIIRIPAGSNTFVPKERMYELMPEFIENLMMYIEKTKKKYDIIHSHYWDGGYGGILLQKMLDIPHVHTPHTLGKAKKLDMAVEAAPVQKLKPYYRYHVRIALEQKIMTKAHATVVICETSRIQILQHYMVDFEKLHVIFPGINPQVFNPKKNQYDTQIKLKKNSILSMCRIVPAKGLDRLLEALVLIKNKVDFHWYIGGSQTGEHLSPEEQNASDKLNALIASHHLQDRVTFIGQVDHDKMVPAYYRNADLFVLASRYEPFGLTTLEAMACGTTPIVSNVAGSKEVIIDGLNGFTVNIHERKQTAELILRLLKDKKLVEKTSENAAFTVKEHYTWDKLVEKFITLYKKLV